MKVSTEESRKNLEKAVDDLFDTADFYRKHPASEGSFQQSHLGALALICACILQATDEIKECIKEGS